MIGFTWLEPHVVVAIHEAQLREHGGASGIRDENAFHSALARPRNLAVYGEPDIVALAAAYAFGIVRNHPFVDGNKRTSLAATELFVDLNGRELMASDAECVEIWLAAAAGSLGEAELTDWLRTQVRQV